MAEFLLELYSEEIPTNLQIDARNNFFQNFKGVLDENHIKYKNLDIFSCPTRIVVHISNLPRTIKTPELEIKGPRVGISNDILENFLKSHSVSKNEVFEKKLDKGNFYFIKKNHKKYF